MRNVCDGRFFLLSENAPYLSAEAVEARYALARQLKIRVSVGTPRRNEICQL
ncbi:hypothetical protein [Paenibacillus jamilae]|uniref:hypothetical protein n=1 Tax=Paenibacillus jamilae TaxID=114136 RepID=UPI000ABF18AC|nr:hypothetical protein [Paenibacillus jamilae]